MPRISFLFFLVILFLPFAVSAIESPTLELGQALFESKDMGTTDRSCGTCHPGGKGLDQVGDFNDTELKEIINACIRDALRGEMLDLETQEMNSLLQYVRTFQKN